MPHPEINQRMRNFTESLDSNNPVHVLNQKQMSWKANEMRGPQVQTSNELTSNIMTGFAGFILGDDFVII